MVKVCFSSALENPGNTQTVGNATGEVFSAKLVVWNRQRFAGDNEPVLAAGMRFCQRTRATLGLQTILTWNRTYEKTRTSVAERFVSNSAWTSKDIDSSS